MEWRSDRSGVCAGVISRGGVVVQEEGGVGSGGGQNAQRAARPLSS